MRMVILYDQKNVAQWCADECLCEPCADAVRRGLPQGDPFLPIVRNRTLPGRKPSLGEPMEAGDFWCRRCAMLRYAARQGRSDPGESAGR